MLNNTWDQSIKKNTFDSILRTRSLGSQWFGMTRRRPDLLTHVHSEGLDVFPDVLHDRFESRYNVCGLHHASQVKEMAEEVG